MLEPSMLPLWIPIIGTLVAAFYASIRPQDNRRTIEICTEELASRWIKEDGVLRVYTSQSHRQCLTIVVECTEPPIGLPSEVDGHPVHIRLTPRA